MMTACASTPPNRSHKSFQRQENYPVPLQCVSRSRHLLPSSLSFDEGNCVTIAPIQFDDGTKKKKPLVPTTAGNRSRGGYGHHRRWGSASSALMSASNLPPLYIPYVPPPTVHNATITSSRPPVLPLLLPRKTKKTTDAADPGGAGSLFRSALHDVGNSLEKSPPKKASGVNQEETSPTVVFRSRQQQQSTTPKNHKNHVKTTAFSSHSMESKGGGSSQSPETPPTCSIIMPQNEDTANNDDKSVAPHTPIMHTLVQGVAHVVETLQERHRKASSRKRISQALLTLRAATLIQQQHEHEHQEPAQQQEDEKEQSWSCYDDDHGIESDDEHDLDLRELGHVLFCPLDQQLLVERHRYGRRHDCQRQSQEGSPKTPTSQKPPSTQNQYGTLRSPRSVTDPMALRSKKNKALSKNHANNDTKKDDNVDDGLEDDHTHMDIPKPPPVYILPEPELSCNPRLLTEDMFQQLIDEGVPECLHLNAWERIFSIGRDGDAFDTFLDRCSNYKQTILAMKTTTGHILGGFVSDPWKEQDGYTQKHSYYGTGMSFLFANHPVLLGQEHHANDSRKSPTSSSSSPLTIFPWTGSNDFCQICDKDRNILAMGGSGAFGFILEDDFYVGSTDHCGTFANPPLTPDKDGMFHVAAMEVYGIVPYGLRDQLDKPIASSSPQRKANAFDLDPKFNPQSLIVHSEELGGFF